MPHHFKVWKETSKQAWRCGSPSKHGGVGRQQQQQVQLIADSALKSLVTLLTIDTHQAKTHPRILITATTGPITKYIGGLRSRESIKQKQHLQGLGRYIMGTTEGTTNDHQLRCTCLESPNLDDANYRKIQCTQNEALRIATGCYKMSSINHLHTESEMLKVREHSELLSAQYMARCLEPENVCHSITTRVIPKKQMKETLYTRHRNTVEPMMGEKDRTTFHTDVVNKAVHERNVVLDGRTPPISNSERLNQEITFDSRSTNIKNRILWSPTRAESRRMQA